MNQQGQTANPYLRTKVLTAGPLELRLMLYDGAVKFCRQARHGLVHRDYETSYNGLMRAQKIVLELSNSLKREADPQLCDRMSALYNYIYRRLVDANMEREVAIVDECIELIEYERETWQMAIKRLDQEQGRDGNTSPQSAAGGATEPTTARRQRNPLASIGSAASASSPPPSTFSAEG